jgi:superfamily II DNA or RNA helicase
MADYFNTHGLKAATALGGDADREQRIQALRTGELQALFTVDALSEGVDVLRWIRLCFYVRPRAQLSSYSSSAAVSG